MSNMSYVRFENTNADLKDCIRALCRMGGNGLDEYGEKLSSYEEDALREMVGNAEVFISQANKIIKLYDEGVEEEENY